MKNETTNQANVSSWTQHRIHEKEKKRSHLQTCSIGFHTLLLLLLPLACTGQAADVNVLIVGTARDSCEFWCEDDQSKPFEIEKVCVELENILQGATNQLGTVQVSHYAFNADGQGNRRLIEAFYSLDPAYPPTGPDLWKTLRGESGFDWDYVLLMEEPYTIEYFPSLYTLGVSEIVKEVAKGNGETILFMGWPGSGSESTVDHYKEVVYRTGRSLGLKVVPAGLAWQAQGSVHGNTHPTDDGAYLAAAAIYSRIWGVEGGRDQSAAESTYQYSESLAIVAHETVKSNQGAVQYSGAFSHPSNVFTRLGDSRREWTMGGRHSSTEDILRTATERAGQQAGMDVVGNGAESGPLGIFVTRTAAWDNAFTMSSQFLHPQATNYDSAEFINRISFDLSYTLRETRRWSISDCPGYRHLPHPALWAQFQKQMPSAPFMERQHGGRGWSLSAGAYLVTMLSGRCPMMANSTEAMAIESTALRVGYETAWQVATLQGRAPCFQVLPSDYNFHKVDPLIPEIMTVRFLLPPEENVTVSVSTNVSWASASPQVLSFTKENYKISQQVRVSLFAEAANFRGEPFSVNYYTSSNDEVFDSLSDSWEYGVNTLPIGEYQKVITLANHITYTKLKSNDPDVNSKVILNERSFVPKQIISYKITEDPQYGKVGLEGDLLTYEPIKDFVGNDRFTFLVFDGLAYSSTNTTVDISVLPQGQYDFNLLTNPGAEFSLLGWTGEWSSNVLQPSNIGIGNAHSGERSFVGQTLNNGIQFVELHQDVDIRSYSSAVNANMQYFHLKGYGVELQYGDARLAIEFRDANGQVLGTPYESDKVNSNTWKLMEVTLPAPANAVIARVILRSYDLEGSSGRNNAAYFDSLSLTAVRPNGVAIPASPPSPLPAPPTMPTSEPMTIVINLSAKDMERNPADSQP